MHILVLGGAGMAGRKFIERLARDGELGGKPIAKITAQDVVAAQAPKGAAFAFDAIVSDLSVPGEAEKLIASRPGLIVHLAAVVSGEAEVGGRTLAGGVMALLSPQRPIKIALRAGTRIMFAGGDPLDGPRHLDWNFVASSNVKSGVDSTGNSAGKSVREKCGLVKTSTHASKHVSFAATGPWFSCSLLLHFCTGLCPICTFAPVLPSPQFKNFSGV